MKVKLISLILLITSISCSSLAAVIDFEDDVELKVNSEPYKAVKAGASETLKQGDVALVMTKEGLPILIFIPSSKESKMTLLKSDIQKIIQGRMAQFTNNQVNEIIDSLRRTEEFMHKREYAKAQAEIAPIRSKYQDVASILFLNASISYLNNNKAMAIEDLEKGLKLSPNNKPAEKLLQKMKDNK